MKSLIVIIFLLSAFVYSEDDSTKVYRLHDVVITGTKTATAIEKLSSSVQVVDSIDFIHTNGISVADKLKNLAGITFRSYGGNGGLQSVSVRGMGSDYSLILVNGQRFTTYQISTVDLGIFSIHDVDRIEIASGGNSSLYGADAVGGVINIITKEPDGKYFATISNSIGSYGLSGFNIATGGGFERISFRSSLNHLRASNAYDFIFNDGSKKYPLQRSGSDYFLKNYSFSARSQFSDKIFSEIVLRLSEADRGQPAVVTNSVQNNLARIQDNDMFFTIATEISLNEKTTVSLPAAYHHNRQHYEDPNLILSGIPLASRYENEIFSFSPLLRYAFSDDHQISIGNELSSASITSNELVHSQRRQASGYLSTYHRFKIPFEFILFPSVRFDMFNDIQGDISSKIGMNISILDQPLVRIRVSYGKNYRVPTFNDLYWVNGGNPNLTPEHSINSDAGIIGSYTQDDFRVRGEVNYFSISATNKIVWQPGANGSWSPKNLQSVHSSGIELSTSLNVSDGLLSINYHHQLLRTMKTSAEFPNDESQNKILPYVPQEFSTLIVGSSFSIVSLNVLYSFTGFRYESVNNNPRFILPTYQNIDLNISLTFLYQLFTLRLKGEVNNVFDENYSLVSGYPVPLRNYLLTSEIIF